MQLYWMAFWVLLPEDCRSHVNYHDMHDDRCLSDAELNEPLVNMRKFIKELPSQHEAGQWKEFQEKLSAIGCTDSSHSNI